MKTDEEQGDYVTEAMTLNGEPSLVIEPERTIIERRGKEFKETIVPAFVKISTSFKDELISISDAALKVWIFIALSVNRKTGTANPGLRTIAGAMSKGVNTIQECIKELEAAKLLQVDRQSRKYNIYEPMGYVSANRDEPSSVSVSDTDEKTVSENDKSVSGGAQSVSDSQILNQRNQREPDLLDGVLHYHLRPKAIRDAIRTHFKLTPNWEAKYNRQFMEWAVETEITPEQIKLAADVWGEDKRFNWAHPNLKGIQEHWLQLIEQPEETEYTRLL